MEVVDHAAQGRARHGHLARRILRRARHRASLDSRHLRSGTKPLHRRHRQSESRHGGEEPARATISTPAPSSPSIPTPESWSGISSPRRTTFTIGTRSRPRSCSTASSTASPANWSRKPAATDTSSCSTASPARALVTKPFIETVNWAKGFDAKGQPIPDPKKFPTTDGVLVSPCSERSHQLARAQLRSRNRPVLRRHQPLLEHVLFDGHRRSPRRLGRTRQHGRQRRQRAAGHRLSDRQAPSGVTTGPAAAASFTICRRRENCCSPATETISSPSTPPTERSSGTPA